MAAGKQKPAAQYTTTKKAKAAADSMSAKVAKDFGFNSTKSKTPVKAKTADAARKSATDRAQMLRGESAEDKAFRLIMEKAKWDITKVPGYKSGGTR
jgi:hypothetical protein